MLVLFSLNFHAYSQSFAYSVDRNVEIEMPSKPEILPYLIYKMAFSESDFYIVGATHFSDMREYDKTQIDSMYLGTLKGMQDAGSRLQGKISDTSINGLFGKYFKSFKDIGDLHNIYITSFMARYKDVFYIFTFWNLYQLDLDKEKEEYFSSIFLKQ